jgi:hypothetical protein
MTANGDPAIRPARQRGLDMRFWHLMRWELRALRGPHRIAWVLVVGLAGAGIVAGAWWVAGLTEETTASILRLRAVTAALLIATPARDEAINIAQMTFGYALLRYTDYGLMLFARAVLPAIAAGTVAGDRKAGRLEELRMMPVGPTIIYLAKAFAPSLPFLLLAALVPMVLVSVLVGESVPAVEVLRLTLEACGQILLAALVAVTCSIAFASPWSARCAAYFVRRQFLPADRGWQPQAVRGTAGRDPRPATHRYRPDAQTAPQRLRPR